MLLVSCLEHGVSCSGCIHHNTVHLEEDGEYWWKVVAKDDRGGESDSDVWKFTTD